MKPKSHLGFIMRDIFSGKDNYSLDIGRILWSIGVITFLTISIYSSVTDTPFDYISWAAGFAAVLAAGGAALRLKETTEPNKELPKKEDK